MSVKARQTQALVARLVCEDARAQIQVFRFVGYFATGAGIHDSILAWFVELAVTRVHWLVTPTPEFFFEQPFAF